MNFFLIFINILDNTNSMASAVDFLWYDFVSHESLLFDEALNCENFSSSFIADFPFLASIFGVQFESSFVSIDALVKSTLFDEWHYSRINKHLRLSILYTSFLTDIFIEFQTKYPFYASFLISDFQDLPSFVLNFSPELLLVYIQYVDHVLDDSWFSLNSGVFFDIYSDSVKFVILEAVDFIFFSFFYFFLALIVLTSLRIQQWVIFTEAPLARFYYYLYSLAKETRIQFDALLFTILIAVFYFITLLMTFDDDLEESIETMSSFWFSFFLMVVLFLIYKHSYHYFSFLEMSVSEGKSASFIAKQFFRDFVNTFALFLRFAILLFRLNVYDGLDDLYDSYYFFLGDFDDDEYHDDLFFNVFASLNFENDNNEDRSFLSEEEHDWTADLFQLYFLVWGKIFFFLFFIVEEILRIALAIYITYLITFDVHAVNCSHIEDFYFFAKKNKKIGSKIKGFSPFKILRYH